MWERISLSNIATDIISNDVLIQYFSNDGLGIALPRISRC